MRKAIVHLSHTLGQAGEHYVIGEIIAAAPSALNGDDAAVMYPATPNSRTVASTDMMVEGRHFRRDWSTPNEIGQKAILRNFADVEAMGARPTVALLAIAAPADTPVNFVRGIAEGIGLRCAFYNAELVGGDLTRSKELVITVTAIGSLGGSQEPLVLSGARPGQKVVSHGKIGYSAAGLALLQEFGRDLPPEHEELWPLIDAHCNPWLKPGRGVIARATGATAMTDNSDGLVPDIGTMAKQSNVHIDLNSHAIAPDSLLVTAGAVLGIDPWEWVLTGGEDHTLVATTQKDAPSGFRVIGTVNRGTGLTIDGNKPRYASGWQSL
ncbi:thiamine monophosphate kinase [Corynebacterium striatum]|uniref:thiamine-phosphate kinase n=1 Tax=Corynebacterium striatum TaxID=43770 RepID=UPI00019C3E66|nr:thiamine-phosphate kinase [Corynebacterium striatum]EEI79125.1 thiamine-phosphate kinase [Corynebacterium striatum ATCC 6940]QQE53437.1 thiamine-phosphate kinase [Corynebacterium striatum]STD61988.1 thiamine monophosphate kinase [Corynebacterium striatum]